MHVLARTLRGLERLAAAELRERLDVRRPELGHREVRLELGALTPALLGLGTVDDVFVVVHDGTPAGRPRSELDRLRRLAATIDLDGVAQLIRPLRAVGGRTFDVSASFRGSRNYTRHEIEDVLGRALATASAWTYLPLPAAGSISLRVHLTAERTTVAARLAARPLHRRAYRVASLPGALHPPLARALVRLATPPGRGPLGDPFCGTGTIAIEAGLERPGLRVLGCDIDPAALGTARVNAAAAGIGAAFLHADAARLPLDDGSLAAVATNPPWNLRVPAAGRLRDGFGPFWRELARVLPMGARAALLTPRAVAPPGFAVAERLPLHLAGTWVEAVVLVREG
jgi:tRNA (guanine6-N2)-methyltransferase